MLQAQLSKIGYHSVRSSTPVSGGSINDCYKVSTESDTVFVKIRKKGMLEDVFQKEANGLDALRGATSSLVIPEVIYKDEDILVLEYLESHPHLSTPGEECGIGLAELHKLSSVEWGWKEDNYIGTLPQINSPLNDGTAFFIRHRLQELLKLINAFDKDEVLDEEKVKQYMQDNIDLRRMSLLHGDLWGGNAFRCADGRGAIFDPAVYYGHPEIDLSMTMMFGGFSSAFYHAYEEEMGLDGSWRERVQFWNLYPLLVHAVLFGGTYVTELRTTLSYFGFIKRQ